LLEEAVEALMEAHPDLEPVDRALEVGEGRTVDLACVDGSGMLWLVSWVREDDAEPILTVLDSMVWFESSHAVLARHFDCPRLRAEAGLRVVLLAEAFPGRLQARLNGLNPSVLRLFELKRLRSARGEHAYLVPVESSRPSAAISETVSVDAFLEALAEDARELARSMMRRVERIDDRLQCTVRAHELIWNLPDGPLCELRAGNGALVTRALPTGQQRRLTRLEDLETSLEDVLEAYVERLPAPSGGRARPADLANVDSAALLSPEEIEAFRRPS